MNANTTPTRAFIRLLDPHHAAEGRRRAEPADARPPVWLPSCKLNLDMTLVTTPEATQLIGCAMRVHSELGPGLFESVYEECLAHEMRKAGLAFRRQVVMPVIYDGRVFPRAFVVDLIVAEQILVELKSVETILPVHDKQVITYLRLSGLTQAFLFNFKSDLLKNGLKSYLASPPK
jgi:GxxExxY protein